MDRASIKFTTIPEGLEVRGKTIRLHFMLNGIRCRETVKLLVTDANIKYCHNLRIEILNKIARNQLNYAEYFPQSKLGKRLGFIEKEQNIKCSVLLEQQLTNYARMVENGHMSPASYNNYRKTIHSKIMPTFANYNVNQITKSMVKDWISSLNVTGKTIYNYIIPLRHMFNDAVNDDLIQVNPLEQLALNKLIQIVSTKSDFNAEPFNDTEKQAIIDGANGQFKNLIQFGFWSGLRISELIALKWGDIDFNNKIAYISRAKVCNTEKGTKTKSGVRALILLPKAFEALIAQLAYTQHSEYIFHNQNTNQPWSSSVKVSDTWRRLLLKLDIKYRNCYQMRHTYASTLLSNGENPWWVATQMGHINVDMIFKRYGKWIPKSENGGYKFVGKY